MALLSEREIAQKKKIQVSWKDMISCIGQTYKIAPQTHAIGWADIFLCWVDWETLFNQFEHVKLEC